tara:strand:- start:748 stop:936 length:189 start_codon:yes stop_codon:yes gene_type:complete
MTFDSNGIWASSPELTEIGLQWLEQEKQQREARVAARQEWFAKWEATRPRGQFGTWNISDRH